MPVAPLSACTWATELTEEERLRAGECSESPDPSVLILEAGMALAAPLIAAFFADLWLGQSPF